MRHTDTGGVQDFDYVRLTAGQKMFVLREIFENRTQRHGPGSEMGITLETARWQRAFQRGLHRQVMAALVDLVDHRYKPGRTSEEGAGFGPSRFTKTWTWRYGERIRFVRASLPALRAEALDRNSLRNSDAVDYEVRCDILAGLLAGQRVLGEGLPAEGLAVGDLDDEEDGFARLIGLQALVKPRRDSTRGRIFEMRRTVQGGLWQPVSPLSPLRLPRGLFEAICPGEQQRTLAA